jgi:hypothetical protein
VGRHVRSYRLSRRGRIETAPIDIEVDVAIGPNARPGEMAPAHNGVLFLDELLEGSDAVRAVHLAETLQYRVLDQPTNPHS